MLLSKSSLYRSRKFSSLKVTDSVLVAVDGSTARFPPKKLQSLQFSMRFHIIEITNAHRGRKLLHTELRLIAFQRKKTREIFPIPSEIHPFNTCTSKLMQIYSKVELQNVVFVVCTWCYCTYLELDFVFLQHALRPYSQRIGR